MPINTDEYRRRIHHDVRQIWWPRWRRRALFVVGGLAVGALAIIMAKLADRAQALFQLMTGYWAWAPFALGPGGFALAAWLTRTLFPGAQGSGIPQVIAAHKMEDLPARARLVRCGSRSGRSCC